MDALMTLTNDDKTNFAVCRIAKENYGIPLVIARVNQPQNLSVMKGAGADIAICPSIETRPLFLNAIENENVETLYERAESGFKLVMVAIPQNGQVVGKTIEMINHSGKVQVASVLRNGTYIFPSESLIFRGNDKVLLLGSSMDVGKAAEKFGRVEIT